MSDDELINRLSAARPQMPTDLLEANPQLIEEILMTDQPTKRRFVTPLRLGAAAAIAVAAAGVAVSLPTTSQAPAPHVEVAAPNMQRIVDATASALSSGRAIVGSVTTSSRPGWKHTSTAAFTVEFSGDNRSMAGTINPGDERGDGSFPFANMVVDHRFYLQDGERWVEDTAANLDGSDVFSVDPRNFLAGVAEPAQFREIGTAEVDGVRTRHLKATRLDDIPDFNLGLGPRGNDENKLTRFELWVDDDNVVRAIVVATRQEEQSYAGARAKLVTDGNGNTKKVLDESTIGDPQTTVTTTIYKVRFTDLGADITITPPPNAPQIEGKG